MNDKSLINKLCILGVLSLPVYVLHEIIGAWYYPGYNWITQAVSDLTAVSSPSFFIAKTLSNIYALLACVNSVLVCIIIQNKSKKTFRIGVYLFSLMNFISAIGYAIFPLSGSGYAGNFQDIVHVFVITPIVVVLSILSLVMIIIGGRKTGFNYHLLSVFAGITLLFMMLGPIGMVFVPKIFFGIVERFSVYSAVTFNVALGLFGLSKG